MKVLLVLAFAVLITGTVSAQPDEWIMDTDDNSIGVYFEPTAVEYCGTAGTFDQVPVHIFLKNPTFAELYGFELSYEVTGPGIITGSAFANPQVTNVGTGTNFIAGFGAPTATEAATLLVTMTCLVTGTDAPISFAISGSDPSSIDPALPTLLLADGQLTSVYFSTIGGLYCAELNGACDPLGDGPVPTDAVSFDSIKSLYR